MKETFPPIAAIDVGTNSFHIIIASVYSQGSLRIYSRKKKMVRLGSSGGDMKYIEPDAMARGIKVLKRFVTMAHEAKAAVIRAIATSAVREALNKAEGLDRRQLQIVQSVRAVVRDETIELYLVPHPARPIPDIELWAARRRRDLLEEALEKRTAFFFGAQATKR